MTKTEAAEVAKFANMHDGGVPQPRAEVVEFAPGDYAVDIRSLSIVTSGARRWTEIDTDRAFSRRSAARILGY